MALLRGCLLAPRWLPALLSALVCFQLLGGVSGAATCPAGGVLLASRGVCAVLTNGVADYFTDLCAEEHTGGVRRLGILEASDGVNASSIAPPEGAFFGLTRTTSRRWGWADLSGRESGFLVWEKDPAHSDASQRCSYTCTTLAVPGCTAGRLYTMDCSSPAPHPGSAGPPKFAAEVPCPEGESAASGMCYGVTTSPPATLGGLGTAFSEGGFATFLEDMGSLGVLFVVIPYIEVDTFGEYSAPDLQVVPHTLWRFGAPRGKRCSKACGSPDGALCDADCFLKHPAMCFQGELTASACAISGGVFSTWFDACIQLSPPAEFTAKMCEPLGSNWVLLAPLSREDVASYVVSIGPSASEAFTSVTRWEFLRREWAWGVPHHSFDTSSMWGGPREPRKQQACAVVSGGMIRSRTCTDLAPTLCESPASAADCPAGNLSASGRCYLVTDSPTAFGQASNAACPGGAATTFSPDDLLLGLTSTTPAWIDFTLMRSTQQAWAYPAGATGYNPAVVWGSQSPYPSGDASKACATLQRGYPFARDLDCASPRRQLCEVPPVEQTPAPPPATPPSSPPPPTHAPPTDLPETTSPEPPPGNGSVTPAPPVPPLEVPGEGGPLEGHGALVVESDREVVRKTTGVAAVGSAAGGILGGAGVVYASQISLILDTECSSRSSWERVSWVLHPTRVALFGSQPAGAVVMNTVLVVSLTAGHALVSLVFAKAIRPRLGGASAPQIPPSKAFLSSQGVLRFPSASFFACLFLFQGTAFASAHLTFLNGSGELLAVGLAGMLMCIAFPILLSLYTAFLVHGVPSGSGAFSTAARWSIHTLCRVPPHFREEAGPARPSPLVVYCQDSEIIGCPISIFFLGAGEWVSLDPDVYHQERFAAVLRPFGPGGAAYGAFLHYASMMGVAICSSVPTTTLQGCGHTKLISSLIYITLLMIHAVIRPASRRRDTVLESLTCVCFAGSMLCVTSALYSKNVNGSLYEASGWFVKIATAFLCIKVLLDLLCELYIFCTGRRDRIQREFLESGKAPLVGVRRVGLLELQEVAPLHTCCLTDTASWAESPSFAAATPSGAGLIPCCGASSLLESAASSSAPANYNPGGLTPGTPSPLHTPGRTPRSNVLPHLPLGCAASASSGTSHPLKRAAQAPPRRRASLMRGIAAAAAALEDVCDDAEDVAGVVGETDVEVAEEEDEESEEGDSVDAHAETYTSLWEKACVAGKGWDISSPMTSPLSEIGGGGAGGAAADPGTPLLWSPLSNGVSPGHSPPLRSPLDSASGQGFHRLRLEMTNARITNVLGRGGALPVPVSNLLDMPVAVSRRGGFAPSPSEGGPSSGGTPRTPARPVSSSSTLYDI